MDEGGGVRNKGEGVSDEEGEVRDEGGGWK